MALRPMNHTRHKYFWLLLVGLVAAMSVLAETPDTIYTNGNIVTADSAFSIRQAMAVTGDRISAMGDVASVQSLAGEGTQIIDLAGKTVIPGLIDNHVHIVRGSRQWHRDVRLTGVHERAEAKRKIAERAEQLGPGEWVVVLGGWTPNQFSDDSSPYSGAAVELEPPDVRLDRQKASGPR